MTSILTIAGSPSAPSRSAAILDYARRYVEQRGHATDSLIVRDLDSTALIHGRFDAESVQMAIAQVAAASAIIIATPVYKAAYSGVLKTFLDLLPPNALTGKVVLPIASGGSPVHMLVVDYALKPVLSALGASLLLPGIYLIDNQFDYTKEPVIFTVPDAEARLTASLDHLLASLSVLQLDATKVNS